MDSTATLMIDMGFYVGSIYCPLLESLLDIHVLPEASSTGTRHPAAAQSQARRALRREPGAFRGLGASFLGCLPIPCGSKDSCFKGFWAQRPCYNTGLLGYLGPEG